MAFMRDPFYILMQDDRANIQSIHHPDVAITIPQETFDEIVMMRYYNMTNEERREAIERVLETQFETGADGVRKRSGLPTAMERVDAELERRQAASYGGAR